MEKNKLIKIIIGVFCTVITAETVLNNFGVIEKIKNDNKISQLTKEKRSWESKCVGEVKMYLKIYDYTEDKELGANLVGIKAQSKKISSYSSTDTYVRVEDIRQRTYKNINLATAFQAGEDGNISQNDYYYFVLPLSCDYVKVGSKRYKSENGEINTKSRGKVKFNICLFHDDSTIDVFKEGTIVFHDKNGKEYKYQT